MTVSAFAGTPAGAYIDNTADLPESCFYLAAEERNSFFDGRRIITECDAGEYVEIALYANDVPALSDLSLSIRGDSGFRIERYKNNYFREARFESEDYREYQYSFSMGRNVSIPNDEILAWLDVELPYSVGMYTFSVTVEDAREQNGDPVPWRTVDLEIRIDDGGGYVVSSYTTPYSTTSGTTISTTSSSSAATPSTTSSSKTTTSASTTTSTTRTTAPPVTMSSTTTTVSTTLAENPPSDSGIIYGDVNGDRMIDARDRMALQHYLLCEDTISAERLFAADVNRDRKVDINDLLLLEMSAARERVQLGEPQSFEGTLTVADIRYIYNGSFCDKIAVKKGEQFYVDIYIDCSEVVKQYALIFDVEGMTLDQYDTSDMDYGYSVICSTYDNQFIISSPFGGTYLGEDDRPNGGVVRFKLTAPGVDGDYTMRLRDLALMDINGKKLATSSSPLLILVGNGAGTSTEPSVSSVTTTTATASSIVEITETNTELITFDTELTTTTTTTEETTVTISETSAETTVAASSEETTASTGASSDTKPYYAKNATIQILPVPDSQDYTVESLISENRIYADYGDEIVLGLYPDGIDATSGYLFYWDCSDVDFIGAEDYPTGITLLPTFNARYANKADSFGQKYVSAVAAASSKSDLLPNVPLVVFRISVPQKDDSRGSRYDDDYVAFSITETNCRVEMVDSNGFTTVKTRYSSFLDENERDVLSQIIPTRIMVKDILVTTSSSMSYGGGPGSESTTESSETTYSTWTETTTTSFRDSTDSESAETTTTSELPASPGGNVTSTTASAEADPTQTGLPQTGVSSPAGLLTICGSLTLIAAGAYVLQHTKRRDEEAK